MNASTHAYASSVGLGIALGFGLSQLLGYWKSYKQDLSKGISKKNDTHAVRSFEECLRIPRESLEQFISELLIKAGASPSHATLVSSVLVYADARSIPSHGVNRADTYINEILAGVVDGRIAPVIEKKEGCCAVVDGRNGLGAVTSELAMNTAIELASEFGVGLVVCRHSNHFGAAGFWARKALQRGLIGMSFTNTSPFAVPTRGKTRAVGTNPFCFFSPAGHDDNFQLDMATTVVPVGKIEVMHRLGKGVPVGWGVDSQGEGCTDGEEICRRGGLYPLGGSEETAGYKGYG